MHLMILENKRLRSTLRPTTAIVSIGSSPQCAVHLPDPRIGPLQANLSRAEDGAWWLEVLDQGVPTCLNRSIQKTKAKLRHADEIEVGQFSIRLFMETDKSREELQRERMLALTRQHGESLPLGAIIHLAENAVTLSKDQIEQLTLLALKLAHMESVRDFLLPVIRAMFRLVDGRRAWIGIRSKPRGAFEWTLCLNDQGQPCDRPAFSQTTENRCMAHTQYVCCPEAPAAGAHSAMAVPLACEGGNLGMLYIENDPADPAYTEATLGIMSALACFVARPVENTLLKSAAHRQVAAGTEHTMARATQDIITPKALPQWDDLQIAAYRFMGSAKCCDFYDIVQLPDKTASIIVARLCAEPSAMPRMLGELRAAFRSASLHADQPHLFCRALNWMLFTGDGRRFVDVAALWVMPKTGKVQYSIAGDGVAIRRIGANGECAALEADTWPAIAKAKSPAYEAATLDMTPGDTLLLATGGINAVASHDGSVLGIQSLEETIADGVGDRPGSLLSEFESELTEFVKNGACPEDVSVLLARWR